MTTPFNRRLLGFLSLTLIITCSYAQTTNFKTVQPILSNGTYIKVYENVLTAFHKQFPGAENITWYTVDKNYLAKFYVKDMEQRALLDRKGNIIYKISYGKEKDLPTNIRKSIKGNYVEFVITSANQVEEANRSIWIVNLEDDDQYITVRVEDSEMEEVQRYKKQ